MLTMADRQPNILICSCDETIPLDGAPVDRACRGAEVLRGRQLCRAELDRVRDAKVRIDTSCAYVHARAREIIEEFSLEMALMRIARKVSMTLPVADVVQRGWRSNPNIALGPNVIGAKANRSRSA
jgi:hypothetical protein